jgi:hypothetical protein
MWGATTDLQECSSGSLPPVDHLGDPQVFLLLEPDAIGHPALFPQSKRYFGWLRSWGRVDARWGPTLVCLDQDGTMTLSHERELLGPLRRMAIIAYMKSGAQTCWLRCESRVMPAQPGSASRPPACPLIEVLRPRRDTHWACAVVLGFGQGDCASGPLPTARHRC